MSSQSPKTELNGRILWADGISEVPAADIEQAILSGIPLENLAVTELTEEVKRLNRLSGTKIGVKEDLNAAFPPPWVLPDRYQLMDVESYLMGLPIKQDELYDKRLMRLAQEIDLFDKHGLFDILRVLIYVIDRFRETNTVWGMGRGSSCSSYILYLIGLHAVDPVKYDIDIKDFIR